MIKFRVWNTETEDWWSKEGLSIWEFLEEVQNDKIFFDFSWKDLKEKLIFQEYIGWNDVNGQEIYEGDIVLVSYGERPLYATDVEIPRIHNLLASEDTVKVLTNVNEESNWHEKMKKQGIIVG